jgi:hypothetical protein
MAMCFIPRHGVHLVHQQEVVDLIICFECNQLQWWAAGRRGLLLTTGSPQPLLDRMLREGSAPLAPH